jgi:hypothetical protein
MMLKPLGGRYDEQYIGWEFRIIYIRGLLHPDTVGTTKMGIQINTNHSVGPAWGLSMMLVGQILSVCHPVWSRLAHERMGDYTPYAVWCTTRSKPYSA